MPDLDRYRAMLQRVRARYGTGERDAADSDAGAQLAAGGSSAELTPVYDPEQIPEGMTEDESDRFWSTHQVTQRLWDQLEAVPSGWKVLPPELVGAFEEAGGRADRRPAAGVPARDTGLGPEAAGDGVGDQRAHDLPGDAGEGDPRAHSSPGRPGAPEAAADPGIDRAGAEAGPGQRRVIYVVLMPLYRDGTQYVPAASLGLPHWRLHREHGVPLHTRIALDPDSPDTLTLQSLGIVSRAPAPDEPESDSEPRGGRFGAIVHRLRGRLR